MKKIEHVLIGSGIILGAVMLWFVKFKPLQNDPNSLWAYDTGLRSTYPGEAFNESDNVTIDLTGVPQN